MKFNVILRKTSISSGKSVLVKYFNFDAIINWVHTSDNDPNDMYKNRTTSFLENLEAPSAILLG